MKAKNFPQLVYSLTEAKKPNIEDLAAHFGDAALGKEARERGELVGKAWSSEVANQTLAAAKEKKDSDEELIRGLRAADALKPPLPETPKTVTVKLPEKLKGKKCDNCKRRTATVAQVVPEQVTGKPAIKHFDVTEDVTDPATGKTTQVTIPNAPHAKFFSLHGDDVWKTLNKSVDMTGQVTVRENERVMHSAGELHSAALKAAGFATEVGYDAKNPNHKKLFEKSLAKVRSGRTRILSKKATDTTPAEYKEVPQFKPGSAEEYTAAVTGAGFSTSGRTEGVVFNAEDPVHLHRYHRAAEAIAKQWNLTSGRPETHKMQHHEATDLGPDAVHVCDSPACQKAKGIDPQSIVTSGKDLFDRSQENAVGSGVSHPGPHMMVSFHRVTKGEEVTPEVKAEVFGTDKEGKPREPFVAQEFHPTPAMETMATGFKVTGQDAEGNKFIRSAVTPLDWFATQNAHAAGFAEREMRKNLSYHYVASRREMATAAPGTTGPGRGGAGSRYFPRGQTRVRTSAASHKPLQARDVVGGFLRQPPTRVKEDPERELRKKVLQKFMVMHGGDKLKAAASLMALFLKSDEEKEKSLQSLGVLGPHNPETLPPAPESEEAVKQTTPEPPKGRKVKKVKSPKP